MAYNPHSAALLPTSTKMNPVCPIDAPYYDRGQFAYVMKHLASGALRLFTSFGDLGSDWAIGTVHEVHHDQTLRSAGEFQVIGKTDFGSHTATGQVPDKKLAHWVFK
jgi:hypothetical protein